MYNGIFKSQLVGRFFSSQNAWNGKESCGNEENDNDDETTLTINK